MYKNQHLYKQSAHRTVDGGRHVSDNPPSSRVSCALDVLLRATLWQSFCQPVSSNYKDTENVYIAPGLCVSTYFHSCKRKFYITKVLWNIFTPGNYCSQKWSQELPNILRLQSTDAMQLWLFHNIQHCISVSVLLHRSEKSTSYLHYGSHNMLHTSTFHGC